LRKPRFNPPAWVFGPVWTILYTLMAVAAWQVAVAPAGAFRSAGLALFAVQLGLNLLWSWIFFRRHAMGAALAEAILLWVAIAATTVLFGQVDGTAAWLMVPYLGWTAFASELNAAIRRLN
jgi:tryptophan-rich sensory protein